MRILLQTWAACFGQTALTLRDVVGQCRARMDTPPEAQTDEDRECVALYSALGAFDQRPGVAVLDPKRLGLALRKWKGRVLGGLRLVEVDKDRKGFTLWRVESPSGTPPRPQQPPPPTTNGDEDPDACRVAEFAELDPVVRAEVSISDTDQGTCDWTDTLGETAKSNSADSANSSDSAVYEMDTFTRIAESDSADSAHAPDQPVATAPMTVCAPAPSYSYITTHNNLRPFCPSCARVHGWGWTLKPRASIGVRIGSD